MANRKSMIIAAIAAGAVFGFTATAHAFQSIPKDWNWELKDGKPVRKGKVEVSAEGNKREVTPLGGGCVKIKEWSGDGEVKIRTECPQPR